MKDTAILRVKLQQIRKCTLRWFWPLQSVNIFCYYARELPSSHRFLRGVYLLGNFYWNKILLFNHIFESFTLTETQQIKRSLKSLKIHSLDKPCLHCTTAFAVYQIQSSDKWFSRCICPVPHVVRTHFP